MNHFKIYQLVNDLINHMLPNYCLDACESITNTDEICYRTSQKLSKSVFNDVMDIIVEIDAKLLLTDLQKLGLSTSKSLRVSNSLEEFIAINEKLRVSDRNLLKVLVLLEDSCFQDNDFIRELMNYETNTSVHPGSGPCSGLLHGKGHSVSDGKFPLFSRSLFDISDHIQLNEEQIGLNLHMSLPPGTGFAKLSLCSVTKSSVPPYSLNLPTCVSFPYDHKKTKIIHDHVETLTISAKSEVVSLESPTQCNICNSLQCSLLSDSSRSSNPNQSSTSLSDENHSSMEYVSPFLYFSSCNDWDDSDLLWHKKTSMSWERRGTHTEEPDERYFTESGPKPFWSSVTSYGDSQRPCSLSQAFVSDLLQLLLGHPSRLFSITKKDGNWEVDFKLHPVGASRYAFQSMFAPFFEASILYVKLKEFCSSIHYLFTDSKDSITNGTKIAMFEYLVCYEKAITSMSIDNLQSIFSLKYIFQYLFQDLRDVAELLGVPLLSAKAIELPTGTELISYLYVKGMEVSSGSLQAVLLLLIKHTFRPYLRFLEQLLFTGTWDNSIEEFKLTYDKELVEAEDESYWLKCLSTLSGDAFVPIFLREEASNILLCAKSIHLLRRCCPEHYLFSNEFEAPNLYVSFTAMAFEDIQKKTFIDILVRIAIMIFQYSEKKLTSKPHIDIISLHHRLWKILKHCSSMVDSYDHSGEVNESRLMRWISQIRDNLEKIHTNADVRKVRTLYPVKRTLPISRSVPQGSMDVCSQTVKGKKWTRCHSWPLDLNKPVTLKQSLVYSGKTTQHVSLEGNLMRSSSLKTALFPLRHCDAWQMSLSYKKDVEICIMDILQSFEQEEETLQELKLQPLKPSGERNVAGHSILQVQSGSQQCSHRCVANLVSYIEEYLYGEKCLKEDKSNLDNIPKMLVQSIVPLVRMQIDMVNTSLIDYFMNDLPLLKHFSFLANCFFLCNEEFGFALCHHIFEEFPEMKTVQKDLSDPKLFGILAKTLAHCGKANNNCAQLLNLKVRPQPLPQHVSGVLKRVYLDYAVPWPCNIIITEQHIKSYNNILIFLLQIQQSFTILKELHINLKNCLSANSKLNFSREYRKVQYFKHEMLHFNKALKSFISNQLLDNVWEGFMMDIKSKVETLDDLRQMHSNCMKAALHSCLLYKNASLALLVRDILKLIFKTCYFLLQKNWICDPNSGQWKHPNYEHIFKYIDIFHEYSLIFYKIIRELYYRTDKEYLHGLILNIDFNSFYSNQVDD